LLAEPGDAFGALFTAAYLAPQKIAVVHHGSAAVLTYAQLYARALRTAAAFLHLGLDKRGRVAVMLANSVGVLLVHFAAAATRTVVINLNTHLAAPELAFMLRSALPEVLVIDNALVSVLTHTLEESIWGRGSAPCSLRSVLWVGGCPDSASLECLSVLGVSSFDFEDLVSHSKIIAPLTLRDLPPRSLDDTFMVSFTEMAIAALLRVLRARISIFCLRSCISPAVPPAAPRWLS
jgi:long-subunit acyl-CoA synthetase (AMP-forming)